MEVWYHISGCHDACDTLLSLTRNMFSKGISKRIPSSWTTSDQPKTHWDLIVPYLQLLEIALDASGDIQY